MSKYLLQQPKKMENVAMDVLAAWTAAQAVKFLTPIWELRRLDHPTQAEAEHSRQIQIIQNTIYNKMPKKFHNTMLSKLLLELRNLVERFGYSDNQAILVGRMAETLFSENITSVSLNNNLYIMLRDCLRSKLHLFSALTHLDLNLDYIFGKQSIKKLGLSFVPFLENMHLLKYLTITHICTDDILRCILYNCELVEELNVSSSNLINDNSIHIVIQLKKLRIINLFRTSVSIRGIETLLLSCKKLEKVFEPTEFEYKNRMPFVLKCILDSTEKFPKLFKLTNYRSTADTVQELQIVVQMCPLIQCLSVMNSVTRREDLSRNNLIAITGLRSLRELTLSQYFYKDQIKKPLLEIGFNLVFLHLSRIKEIDMVALMEISQLCPNLDTFTLDNCRFSGHTRLFDTELTFLPFRNLKKVVLDTTKSFEVVPSNYFFYHSEEVRNMLTLHSNEHLNSIREITCFLLWNCLNVEVIELSGSGWLTEEFMLQVLDTNPLIYLKTLQVQERVAITKLVIDRIIENCINRPEIFFCN